MEESFRAELAHNWKASVACTGGCAALAAPGGRFSRWVGLRAYLRRQGPFWVVHGHSSKAGALVRLGACVGGPHHPSTRRTPFERRIPDWGGWATGSTRGRSDDWPRWEAP